FRFLRTFALTSVAAFGAATYALNPQWRPQFSLDDILARVAGRPTKIRARGGAGRRHGAHFRFLRTFALTSVAAFGAATYALNPQWRPQFSL
ncbi:hypothetical protein CTI14_63795, partial [Methylobacterium radiotolerans]